MYSLKHYYHPGFWSLRESHSFSSCFILICNQSQLNCSFIFKIMLLVTRLRFKWAGEKKKKQASGKKNGLLIFSKYFVCKACMSFQLMVKTVLCREWSLQVQLHSTAKFRVCPTPLPLLVLNNFGIPFQKHCLCLTNHVECPVLCESMVKSENRFVLETHDSILKKKSKI